MPKCSRARSTEGKGRLPNRLQILNCRLSARYMTFPEALNTRIASSTCFEILGARILCFAE